MVSWREEKKGRTRAALADAALRLFAEDGYEAVTMADIARAAEVGERTVYRYFFDKEELLFADDHRINEALTEAMTAQPLEAGPLTAMRGAARSIAGVFEGQHETLCRRAELIAATPALRARERFKQDGWQARLAEMLVARGVPSPQALHGAIGVACFAEALTRWLAVEHADGPQCGDRAALADEFERTLSDVATLTADT